MAASRAGHNRPDVIDLALWRLHWRPDTPFRRRVHEAEGHAIEPWTLTGGLWLEIGNLERLESARALLGVSRT